MMWFWALILLAITHPCIAQECNQKARGITPRCGMVKRSHTDVSEWDYGWRWNTTKRYWLTRPYYTCPSTWTPSASPTNTDTQTVTDTDTPTETPTRSETATRSFSDTDTVSYSRSATGVSNSLTPTRSSSRSESASRTGASSTPSRSSSPSPTFSWTASESETGTRTSTPTPTYTASPSSTRSPTSSWTSTRTATATTTPTVTLTASVTRSSSPTQSASFTPTATLTRSSTPTRSQDSATPTATGSITHLHTDTYTPTTTDTPTLSETPTDTATDTATHTPTSTRTTSRTPTGSPSLTSTESSSNSATATPSITPTATPTTTLTRSLTPTTTLTRTLSFTNTPSHSASPSISRTRSPTDTTSPTRSVTHSLSSTATRTPTASPTRSLTRTSTATWTTTLTRSISPSRSLTATHTPSPSLSHTVTWTTTLTATTSVSRTPSRSPSKTASPTPTSTRTHGSASSTSTVTPTRTSSRTPSATATFTVTPSRSNTRSRTATFTVTPSRSSSPTATPTTTLTPSKSATSSQTRTRSSTVTPTGTPTWTTTLTRSSTATPTPSGSLTRSSTRTGTVTPTYTPTRTPTSTGTRTPSPSGTPSRTRTSTRTGTVSPTLSRTSSRTPTRTSTWTPTGTPTTTPTTTLTRSTSATRSPTSTSTPTWTLTPSATPTVTLTGTVTPTTTLTASPSLTPTTTLSRSSTHSSTPTVTLTRTPSRTVTASPTRTVTRTPSHTWSSTFSLTRTVSTTHTSTPTTTLTPSPSRTGTSTSTPTVTLTRSVSASATTTITLTPTTTLTKSPSLTTTPTPSGCDAPYVQVGYNALNCGAFGPVAAGEVCTATCDAADGWCGTPVGAPICLAGAYVTTAPHGSVFSGCVPCDCTTGAYTQANYIVDGCFSGTLHGQRCGAFCSPNRGIAPGYCGIVTGYKECWHGQWKGPGFSGCEPCACPTAYTQSSYVVTLCPAGSPHGRQCAASCQSGWCGAVDPMETVVCDRGEWIGRFRGCSPCPCTNQYVQTGYTLTGCNANAPSGQSCFASCTPGFAPGYCGNAVGSLQCQRGVWTGPGFAGCQPCACQAAYTQVGYVVNGCGVNSPHNTACNAVCEVGYCAWKVQGTVRCNMGVWSHPANDAFTGCAPCGCPGPYKQSRYIISGCSGNPVPHNSVCTAVCDGDVTGVGYCADPSVVGDQRCRFGKWIGSGFSGCVPCPCPTAYSIPAGNYIITGCGAGTAHGTRCRADCSPNFGTPPGYCGTVSGNIECFEGKWVGSGFTGCKACACPLSYKQTRYVVVGCPAGSADGTICSAYCADGYCGSVTGSPQCTLGQWAGTAFSGCNPCGCTTAYVQPGYDVAPATCKNGGATHNQVCTATCLSTATQRFCPTPSVGGYAECKFGVWQGPGFDGCEPCPCAAGYAPGVEYAVTGCGDYAPNGRRCTVACAVGYCGAPVGEVYCDQGVWESPSGGYSGCSACACAAYVQSPYVVDTAACNTAPVPHTTTCVSTSCQSGYCNAAAVTGSPQCNFGRWEGSVFGGCAPCKCPAPYTQTGFIITYCDGATTPHNTICGAICDSGNAYCGSVSGSKSCMFGKYEGAGFTGCAPCGCNVAYTQANYEVIGCPTGSSSGASCTALCAEGFAGSPAETVRCVGGLWTGGPFTGCTAAPCAAAYSQSGPYVIGTCGAGGVASGTQCTATCATAPNMYCPQSGGVSGTISCFLGKYEGSPFTGCIPCPCTSGPAPQTVVSPPLFSITNCPSGTPHGRVCVATCSPGHCLTSSGITGGWQCSYGSWDGSDFVGCQPCACTAAYTQLPAYNITGCGAYTPHSTSCVATCATGYEVIVSLQGDIACQYGKYTGTPFSGCVPARCASAWDQSPAYTVSNCGLNTAHNTACTAVCAPGYCGTVSGSQTCAFGVYTSAVGFKGCSECACSGAYTQLPEYAVSGCPAGTLSGTQCSSACAVGHCRSGPITGTVTCLRGAWSGSYSGCSACECAVAYTQLPEYDTLVCGASGLPVAHDTTCTVQCATGYEGTPSVGSIKCRFGKYEGSPFSGCSPKACAAAYAAGTTLDMLTCNAGDVPVPSGFRCSATCKASPAHCGVVTGSIFCTAGVYTGPGFTGCTPCACAGAYRQAGYKVTSCDGRIAADDAGTLHNTPCGATCEAGYCGAVTGTAKCWYGSYADTMGTVALNLFGGCTPCRCVAPIAPYTQDPGYTIGGCNTDPVAHNTACTATCASGYEIGATGAISGGVRCMYGQFVGTPFSGCIASPCSMAYMNPLPGYTLQTCDAGSPSGTQCVATCTLSPDRYCGAAVDGPRCKEGTWQGATFTGCNPCPCTAAYTQPPEYRIDNCPAGSPHDTVCVASCNPGYCTSPTGTVECKFGIWVGGPYMGCSPCACPNAYTQGSAYSIAGCDGPTGHGTSCSAACATGYCGSLVGWQRCDFGSYVNPIGFEGCSACPCSSTYSQPDLAAYTLSGCSAGALHGTVCTAKCARGYCSSTGVGGGITCKLGVWDGTAYTGCSPCRCSAAYFQLNYEILNCGSPAGVDHGVECTARCANDMGMVTGFPIGWCGTATDNAVRCLYGTYVGAGFSGCVPCQCQTAYVESAAYEIELCSPPPIPSGQVCNARCASGYCGSPSGSVACVEGAWVRGMGTGIGFLGCDPCPCTASYRQINYIISKCDGGASTPHGAQCRAVCADGYCGTVTGFARCELGQYVTSTSPTGFDGCIECRCSSAYYAPVYDLSTSCAANAPPGAICTSDRCATTDYCLLPGYTTPGGGSIVCQLGKWVGGPFTGCEPCPCTMGYTQMAYDVTGCENGVPVAHGATCSATCQAPSWCGVPVGTVTCNFGNYMGSYMNCEPCECTTPYFQPPEYVIMGCSGFTPHNTVCTATCAEGFELDPMIGVVSCDKTCNAGVWEGTGCTGCREAYCAMGWSQPEYDIMGCGPMTPPGTMCTATCAAGYDGTVSGGQTCVRGQWNSLVGFTGCKEARCMGPLMPPPAYIGNEVCQDSTARSGSICTGECNRAGGYCGIASAQYRCDKGMWYTDVAWSGCSECCVNAYTQVGYITTQSCASGAVPTTVCTPYSCANGYAIAADGTPMGGSKTCSMGSPSSWTGGGFTGCWKSCPAFVVPDSERAKYSIPCSYGDVHQYRVTCPVACEPSDTQTQGGFTYTLACNNGRWEKDGNWGTERTFAGEMVGKCCHPVSEHWCNGGGGQCKPVGVNC